MTLTDQTIIKRGPSQAPGINSKLAVTFSEKTMQTIKWLANANAISRGEAIRRLVDRSLEEMGLPR